MKSSKILFKPESNMEPMEIFGVNYLKIIREPNVFVVDTIEDRPEDLTLVESYNGITVTHDLEGCTYTEVGENVHIECRKWKSEFSE